MYICLDCGHVFEEPHKIVDNSSEYGRTEERLCPNCEGSFMLTADRCPDCDRWKPKLDNLCERCRDELRKKFRAFREMLTAAQEDVLDEMLDGESIKDI